MWLSLPGAGYRYNYRSNAFGDQNPTGDNNPLYDVRWATRSTLV
jgi:hypothetical protein